MKNYMDKIAVCGNENRRNAITGILDSLKVDYKIVGKTTKNIVVSFNESSNEQIIVIGAHYDAATPYCQGANDNGAACVILLNLIENLRESKMPYEFVFFDKEDERLFGSSYEYIDIVGRNNIKAMINLDMCGMGNNIITHLNRCGTDVLEEYPFKDIIKDSTNVILEDLEGDNWRFSLTGIPNIMIISSTIKCYVKFAKVALGYEGQAADFLKTMHKETDTINIEDVEKIYNYLIERLK